MANDCKTLLEKAASELSEFSPQLVEGRLVIYGSAGRLTFVYSAECTGDGRLLSIAGFPGFFESLPGGDAGREVLVRLLELSGNEYLLVSKVDNNLLVAEPAPVEPSIDAVRRFFSLTALVALWLAEQLDRAERGEPTRPFSVEEAARLVLGSSQQAGEDEAGTG